MNKSRRQHTVPQMLTKRFADEYKKLYYFDKNKREKGVELRSTKGCFWEPHYYTARSEDGQKDISLENDFARNEGKTDPVIEKIVNASRKGEKSNLTEEEKKTWDHFLCGQLRRTPDFLKKYDLDKFIDDEIGRSNRALTAKERKRREDPKQRERDNQTVKVGALKLGAPLSLESLNNKGLGIVKIKSPNKSFIIGSFPIVKLALNGRSHLSDFTVELWLPIAHDIAVTPYHAKGVEELVSIDDNMVRKLNLLITKQSSQIAGRSEKLIKSLANLR